MLVVDSSGKKCPQPIIDLQTAIRKADSGSVVCLISTDEGARYDVPAWVNVNRHDLLEIQNSDGGYHFYVKVK